MPQLGETVTEGTITRWMKKVGDPVLQDEVLFEVSTDKVDSEVPSSASGFLTQILVQEGETVDVGTAIAIVEAEAGATPPPPPVAATPPPPPIETPPPAPVAATPPPPPPVAPTPPPAPPAADPAPAPIAYTPPSVAPTSTPEPSQASNSGPAKVDAGQVAASPADALLLSPVVRKLINENGLDPADIEGTGAGGRVTRSDVLNYLDRSGSRAPRVQSAPSVITTESTRPVSAPAPSAPAPQSQVQAPQSQAPAPQNQAPAVRAGARDEVIPFDNIRRRTAEHMVRSKATSAHTLVAIEVDFEAVEKVRRDSGAGFKAEEGFSLTYLPFIARAVVEAMRNYPKVNASVGDDALIVHKDVNLSIAVDLNLEGLIAPVVHNADTKRMRGIAREIKDLADRARARQLSLDDISGGTFTITNPGPFGTFMTGPIINQPQIAILSTDGIKRKPVVINHPDGTESIGIHSVGLLALSFDHRALDGAYASAFLAQIKKIIEEWNWAQEV